MSEPTKGGGALRAVHLLGIGGIGMSGLARILHADGVTVTGSDIGETDLIAALRREGVDVRIGHRAENVGDVDLVAYSTAIREGNPELQEAERRGIEVCHRSRLLAHIVAGRETVAVTGTHGKTTTSAMLGCALVDVGWDPVVLVGGEVPQLGGNARPGRGRFAVIEADESDASFLNLSPTHAIVTNMEADHLDQYGGFDAIRSAFGRFVEKLPVEGVCVLGVDSPPVAALTPASARRVTYAVDAEADYRARDVRIDEAGARFAIEPLSGPSVPARVPYPGRHYVENALAVFAMACELGAPAESVLATIAGFRGTARRFDRLGRFRGAEIIDDYAHHPSEVLATVHAARTVARGRLITVFQPHLYTRTYFLLDDFASAFGEPDVAIITEIYAAREEASAAPVTGADLAERVAKNRHGRVSRFCPTLDDVRAALLEIARPGDTILLMGAGSIRGLSERLAAEGGGAP